MTSRVTVDDFLARKSLAMVGISRGGKKFGNLAYRDLKSKGYRLFPVHPEASTVECDPCYTSLAALPEPVDGIFVCLPPDQTEQVVRDAAQAGITRVWLQQGAASEAAIRFCEDRNMSVVHGECILMFAKPLKLGHRLHRWVWGLLGKLPK